MAAIMVSMKSPTPHQLATKPITPSGRSVIQSKSKPLSKRPISPFSRPLPPDMKIKRHTVPMMTTDKMFGM